MKIIEREKEMEQKAIENHVKQLEYEQRKAEKQLERTLHTLDMANFVQHRKETDFQNKMQWIKEKNDNIEMQRSKNTQQREERKANISENRKRVIMNNIMARDKQIQDLNQQNQIYN